MNCLRNVAELNKFTWIHLIKFKSKVGTFLDSFLEIPIIINVKCVKLDNVLELSQWAIIQYAKGYYIH